MNLPLRPRAKCDKQTVGLLLRRHIKIDQIKYIGKESNNLEEVEVGLEHSEQNIYTEYPDPRRDEWETKIRPALQAAQLADLERLCKGKISRRALIDLRAGRSRPQKKNKKRLVTVLRKLHRNLSEPPHGLYYCSRCLRLIYKENRDQ